MDTVRTDNKVVGASRAVGEAHPICMAVVIELCHGEAESQRNLGAPRAEGFVQCRSASRDTGCDAVPVAANVDVGEQAATVVEEPLPHDRVRTRCELRPDPELVERPDAVARQIQAGAARRPLGHPLDDLDRDVPQPEGAGKRQTGDAGTDDQHTRCHGRSAGTSSARSTWL